MKDYYSILEIEKGASQDEIKKAYRKLAVKFHPDKNPEGEGRFKEINEAYEVLGDEAKRQQYDNGGQTKNLDDLFSAFNGFSFGGDIFTQNWGIDLDIVLNQKVTLAEVLSGKRLDLAYNKKGDTTQTRLSVEINPDTTRHELLFDGSRVFSRLTFRGMGNQGTLNSQQFTRNFIGNLYVLLEIQLPTGIQIDQAGNIIHDEEVTLDQLINLDNLVIKSASGASYKIKSLKAKTLSDIRITVPKKGLFSNRAVERGSYIIRLHVTNPIFDKLSEEEKSNLISLINKTK